MALSQSTLASALASLVPTTDEVEAIQRIVDAWSDYFSGSTVNGAPLVGASISAGLGAMSAAMVGISSPNAAATSFQLGIAAFWTAQLALASSMWITAPVVLVPPIVPPPTLSGIAVALQPIFDANTAGNVTLSDACSAVAAVLHTNGGLGALVPGSVPPVPPAPLPML